MLVFHRHRRNRYRRAQTNRINTNARNAYSSISIQSIFIFNRIVNVLKFVMSLILWLRFYGYAVQISSPGGENWMGEPYVMIHNLWIEQAKQIMWWHFNICYLYTHFSAVDRFIHATLYKIQLELEFFLLCCSHLIASPSNFNKIQVI